MSELKNASRAPDVWIADEFATAQECLHVERRGGHWDFITEYAIPTNHDRSGFSFELPIDGDVVLEGLRARIEAAVGLHNELGVTFRFRRYAPGEGHRPHVDCYEAEGFLLVATALLYLSDTAEGGATTFPRSGVRITPKLGRLAVWFNYASDGAPDPSALHEGEMVRTGTKATASYFFYADKAQLSHRPP